jgi:cysteine desulfurase family protein (TIGR01976 family)
MDETVGRRLRAITPAILHGEARGWSYFDGPSGTQMIEPAIAATAEFSRTGLANRFNPSPAGDETEHVIASARAELRAMFRAPEHDVVFGQNMTSLAFAFGHAFARRWGREGGSVVVTALEHSGNVDSWAQPFAERGVRTAVVDIDSETLDLEPDGYERVNAEGGVALVAVTAAANAVGVRPDVGPAHGFARAHGALFVVDGVHATPHGPPDVADIDADVYLCSAYKFYGPHIGVALVKKELLEELHPYKVTPAPDSGADKLETGTQNHEAIAGLAATVCGLGRLVGRPTGQGARDALHALGEADGDSARTLADELRAIPGVRVYGHLDKKTAYAPTIALTVRGTTPEDVGQALRASGVFVTTGDFYASGLARRLGVDAAGGWVRIGLSGYTTREDMDRLVASLWRIAVAVG